MLSSLLPLVLAGPILVGAETTFDPGTQLVYRGGVSELLPDRTPDDPKKTFDLTLLVADSDAASTKVYWLVEERGQGAWPWIERFGLLTLDAAGRGAGAPGPALLYDYGEGKSVIPLPEPAFAAEGTLAAGATWEANGFQYEVEDQDELAGRATWRIAVSNNFGRKRVLWLDQDSSLVVGVDERVFMNKGTEYRLQIRLVGTDRLPEADAARTAGGFAALVGLREKLNRPAQSDDEEWSPEQREILAAGLPELAKTITSGSLVKLVRAAGRDLELQSGRADSVAELRAEFEGRHVDDFSVKSLGRDPLTAADLDGQVTILHFWDYRDEPLEEPYGQVGYLEFLHSRRHKEGLKVHGVAVDGRLNDDDTRGAATASVRKLKSFMNLSYPISLDGGSLLKQFGDPRLIGAKLPLFVVIGPNRTIVHYHVGNYDVDKLEGLKELDQVVGEALKKEAVKKKGQ